MGTKNSTQLLHKNLKPFNSRWGSFRRAFVKTRYLQLMMLLPIIYFIIFHYIPMYGIIIAFKDFNMKKGILGSEWIGLEQFIRFFKHPLAWRVIKNTLIINFYSIIWCFPAPIILAIFLNELRNNTYKRFVQTISYLPHFISIVAVVGMLSLFLSPTGFVNTILGKWFGIKPIYFMLSSDWYRTIYIVSDIWQTVGWGAIIYIAAISGVDQQLYEAATVDGANRFNKIWHITLPAIKPTIVILLIMRIGSMMSGNFEKVLLMDQPTIRDVCDIISTFAYRVGLQEGKFNFGTAIGLLNSVINVLFLVTANWISKRVTEDSLW